MQSSCRLSDRDAPAVSSKSKAALVLVHARTDPAAAAGRTSFLHFLLLGSSRGPPKHRSGQHAISDGAIPTMSGVFVPLLV